MAQKKDTTVFHIKDVEPYIIKTSENNYQFDYKSDIRLFALSRELNTAYYEGWDMFIFDRAVQIVKVSFDTRDNFNFTVKDSVRFKKHQRFIDRSNEFYNDHMRNSFQPKYT